MLRHDAVRLSPFGYATRPDERGTMYATAGGLYLEVGGVMKPVLLPPDKIDTWEPVLPEVQLETQVPQASISTIEEPVSGLEPERWADDEILPNSKRVIHRGKRRPPLLPS